MGNNLSKQDAREGAREFQEEKGEGTDSSKQFSAAEHQARNDYQDEGSPFGELGNRDRESKSDVPDKVEDDTDTDSDTDSDADTDSDTDTDSDGDSDSDSSGDSDSDSGGDSDAGGDE